MHRVEPCITKVTSIASAANSSPIRPTVEQAVSAQERPSQTRNKSAPSTATSSAISEQDMKPAGAPCSTSQMPVSEKSAATSWPIFPVDRITTGAEPFTISAPSGTSTPISSATWPLWTAKPTVLPAPSVVPSTIRAPSTAFPATFMPTMLLPIVRAAELSIMTWAVPSTPFPGNSTAITLHPSHRLTAESSPITETSTGLPATSPTTTPKPKKLPPIQSMAGSSPISEPERSEAFQATSARTRPNPPTRLSAVSFTAALKA